MEVLEMLRTEVDRIVEIAHGEDSYIDSEKKSTIITEINQFAGSDVIDMNELAGSEDYDEIKDKLFSLLSGRIEKLRDTGTEEEFAEFERRLTLAAIDELWMHHIDSMAHLREEVAFEGYAQKNPLIIYKERAYDKFVILIDTIGLRVIK
jgi:preprotein translocase subunit SecA